MARKGPLVRCRFCQVPLHQAADWKADQFVMVDARGRQTGPDSDLAHLKPDPYAYLAKLGKRCEQGDMTAAAEYSALKVRLESGTWHTHWADGPGPAYPGPVPECCGWPAWLRPSGWWCRQTSKPLGQCDGNAPQRPPAKAAARGRRTSPKGGRA